MACADRDRPSPFCAVELAVGKVLRHEMRTISVLHRCARTTSASLLFEILKENPSRRPPYYRRPATHKPISCALRYKLACQSETAPKHSIRLGRNCSLRDSQVIAPSHGPALRPSIFLPRPLRPPANAATCRVSKIACEGLERLERPDILRLMCVSDILGTQRLEPRGKPLQRP